MSSRRGSTVSVRLVPLMVRVMDRVMVEVPADMTITQVDGGGKLAGGRVSMRFKCFDKPTSLVPNRGPSSSAPKGLENDDSLRLRT